MIPQTEHWLDIADYDMETADAMFRTGRFRHNGSGYYHRASHLLHRRIRSRDAPRLPRRDQAHGEGRLLTRLILWAERVVHPPLPTQHPRAAEME